MKTIAEMNQKGGTGKTTSAATRWIHLQKLFTVVRTPAVISRIALASSSQFAVACSVVMPICGTSIVFSLMWKALPIFPAQQDIAGH